MEARPPILGQLWKQSLGEVALGHGERHRPRDSSAKAVREERVGEQGNWVGDGGDPARDAQQRERADDERHGEADHAARRVAVAARGDPALSDEAAVHVHGGPSLGHRGQNPGCRVAVRRRLGALHQLAFGRWDLEPNIVVRFLLVLEPLERILVDLEEDVLEGGARGAIVIDAQLSKVFVELLEERLEHRELVARQAHARLALRLALERRKRHVLLHKREQHLFIKLGRGSCHRLGDGESVAGAQMLLEE